MVVAHPVANPLAHAHRRRDRPEKCDETETMIQTTRNLLSVFAFLVLAPILVGQTPATEELPPRPERILLTWSGDPATTHSRHLADGRTRDPGPGRVDPGQRRSA